MNIERLYKHDNCIIGKLEVHGYYFSTLELPDNYNRRGKSCIPSGLYICNRVNSPHFGETFEVSGVNGRSHILFHKGDTAEDTRGCILIGEHGCTTEKEFSNSNSTNAFRMFMNCLRNMESFTLQIYD